MRPATSTLLITSTASSSPASLPALQQRQRGRARSAPEPEEEDKAKLEWLRAAAKEGFDAIECGDYVTLESDQEIDDFVDQIRREVTEKLAHG